MRKIKFRAWDKIQKRMISNGELFILDCSNELPFLPLANNFYDKDEKGNNSEFVVMQYTGIKDIHGVEIYEGDIVKCVEFTILGDSIEYIFVCEYDVYCASFVFNSKNNETNDIRYFENYEVIGNIFENKELLEEISK